MIGQAKVHPTKYRMVPHDGTEQGIQNEDRKTNVLDPSDTPKKYFDNGALYDWMAHDAPALEEEVGGSN